MFHKLLIAILLLCGIALAQPPQGAPGMHGGPGFGEPHRHFGPLAAIDTHNCRGYNECSLILD